MDKDLLNRKLTSLSRCLERIKTKTPRSLEVLKTDIDSQDIISVNLERAIQICVDVASHLIASRRLRSPGSMAESFSVLGESGIVPMECGQRLAKAVGFRNIAVHQYDQVNWDIVYSLVTQDLEIFQEFGQAVLNAMRVKSPEAPGQ